MKNTNTSLKSERLAFLNATIQHFNYQNRAVTRSDGLSCKYSHEVNGGCAIGRVIPAKLALELDAMPAPGISDNRVFNRLPMKLKRLGKAFLYTIQRLHDAVENWDKHGLSGSGIVRVCQIKEEFALE